MTSVTIRDQRHIFLTTVLAIRCERKVALAIAAAGVFLCAAAVPFARLPLAQLPAFIPGYEAPLFFLDVITAALLFDQFARLRSIGVLVVACGYLFDALMIVPHALGFPGAFTRTGLLGATTQTTAWLYVFWHGGFPLFVIGYAVLRRLEEKAPPLRMPQSKQRVVDLWLMVVMWIWLFDLALSVIVGSHRFDLGFYAGRIFGLIAASFLLIALLVEMARLHAIAVGAAASAEARLAQFARRRDHGELATPRGARTDTFIHRQNIAHYRSLLKSGSLDEAQRRSIEKLLDEEETKIRLEQKGA